MVVLALLLAVLATAQAETAARTLLAAKAMAQLQALDGRVHGVLGVAAIDLTTGETLRFHDDRVFAQASAIKVPILLQVFRAARAGTLRLDDTVTIAPAKSVGGSGHLKILLRAGAVTMRVRDLAGAMIETSDNTATNVLIEMVGMESVNRMLDEAGFPGTRLRRVMLDSPAAARGEENVSTPAEMARMMQSIYRDKQDGAATIEMMKRVEADFRGAVPAGIPVASKPGELAGVRCESGIVLHPRRPFALSVMSAFLDDGENPVPDAVRIVFSYFDKLARSNEYGNRLQ